MPLNARRLRLWLVATAVLLVVVVVGSYSYARYRLRKAIHDIPAKLGLEIQQSTHGFTYSHSAGNRTEWTIHASEFKQFKEGGRAQLHDVSIIVYGKQSNRYDQISGSDFEYDPQTGVVRAQGEVSIDLQADAQGKARPDQAPPQELKNPLHIKTRGLEFDKNTGVAHTAEGIEFRTPQASGSSQGATYDSKAGLLTLESHIVIHTTGKRAADIEARHAVITRDPMEASLDDVSGATGPNSFAAGTAHIFFRNENTVERVVAANVHASRSGPAPASARAQSAELFVTEHNTLRNAVMSGNVVLDSTGSRPMHAEAGRVLVAFAPKNQVAHVQALENVIMTQHSAAAASRASGKADRGATPSPQGFELTAATVDFDIKNGRLLEHAYTTGPARIDIDQTAQASQSAQPGASLSAIAAKSGQPSHTVITAGRFDVTFDNRNRLRVLHGAPDTKIVSTTPGQPDRITTSRELDVTFASAGPAGATSIASVQQQGDFRYADGTRSATANRGRYTEADEIFQLTGAPRYSDSGVTLTANAMRLNRRTGDVVAEGDVKTTYSDVKPQPGGALLASGSPVHVTSAIMTSRRADGAAHFSGGARLWQDANIVEASTIEFDRDHRTMVATTAGSATPQRVTTVFTQTDKSGKATPVNVTAARLTYDDAQHRAQFTGGVEMRGSDVMVTADHADVLLQPRTGSAIGAGYAPIPVQQPAANPAQNANFGVPGNSLGPSQLQQIIGEGNVVVQQANRRAKGNRLVYSAQDAKFVMTGGPPSIFDAEHGTVTGDSLTFFSRDDRVVVESNGTTKTVNQTKVTK